MTIQKIESLFEIVQTLKDLEDLKQAIDKMSIDDYVNIEVYRQNKGYDETFFIKNKIFLKHFSKFIASEIEYCEKEIEKA